LLLDLIEATTDRKLKLEFLNLMIFVVIINGLFALIPANLAKNKGHSFAGFWAFGFFLSFVLALVVALVIENRNNSRAILAKDTHIVENGLSQTLKCPSCAEWIKAEANICKHCQSSVADEFTNILREEKRLADELEKQRVADLERSVLEAQELELMAEESRQETIRKIKKFLKTKLGIGLIAAIMSLIAFSVGSSIYSYAEHERENQRESARIDAKIAPYQDWAASLKKCSKPANSKFAFTSDTLSIEVILTQLVIDQTSTPEENGGYFLDEASIAFTDCIYSAILPRFQSVYYFGDVYSTVKSSDGSNVNLEWIKSSDDGFYAYCFYNGCDFGTKFGITLKKGKDYLEALRSWASQYGAVISERD